MKHELLLVGSINPRVEGLIAKNFNVHKLQEISDVDAFLKEQGASIEAVATNGHAGCPTELMEALPNLKVISSNGVGYDAIDANAAAARGIVVCHTPDVLNADVANTAVMLMLAVSRRLVVDDAYVRAGRWVKEGAAPLRQSMEGKKVGIVGLGRVGETIAKKLQAFDMDISYHSRNQKDGVPFKYYGNLVEMARDVEYLVVITPGGASTNKLINRDVMDALGAEGTLINIARGSVVDEAEMVKALQDGRLGAAGLDVYEEEPVVPEALFAMENVVLLPHVGSATTETREAMGNLVVENLERFFADGKATSPVPECAHL